MWRFVFGLLVLASACGAHRETYIEENEALLANIAPFPSVQVVEVVHTPYENNDHGIGGADGFITRFVYTVPVGVEAGPILDHYAELLGGSWTQTRDPGCYEGCDYSIEGPTAQFTRANQLIAFNFDSLGARQFEVALDHSN